MADDETKEVERVKYTVHAASIKGEDGKKVRHGEPVELGPKLARHYNDLGYLRPYIPDTDDDDEVVSDARTPAQKRAVKEDAPKPRSNRTTPL